MSHEGRALSTDVQDRLDEYLDAVDRVLADGGVPRSERRSVCDELEAQACEMAWQRAEDDPSVLDMDAVLTEMDDPEAYRESGPAADTPGGPPSPGTERKVHPFALWAVLLPAGGVLLVFTPLGPHGEAPASVWFGVIALLSVVLAVLAIREIRANPARYYGTFLALLGAFAFPLVLVHTAIAFNAQEIDPFGAYKHMIAELLAREHSEAAARQKEAHRKLVERQREAHLAEHGTDVPFEPPRPPETTGGEAPAPQPVQHWSEARMRVMLVLTHVVVNALPAALSILVFVGLYRWCRQPRDLPSPSADQART